MTKPMLSPDIQEVLQDCPGSYASAVGDDNAPVIARVCGLTVEDADHVRVHIPQWYSKAFLAALQDRPAMAVVGVQVTTYRTFQLKGEALEDFPSTDADVAAVESYVAGFGALIEHVGLDSKRYNPIYAAPPYHTVRLRVDQVFDQTPRVGAGNLVKERD